MVKKLLLLKKRAVSSSPVKKHRAPIAARKPTGTRRHARYNVAVLVKVTGQDNTIGPTMVCTYEVSLEGCKIPNYAGLDRDQLVWLNRNNRKAVYKVVWTSAHKNQVGLQMARSGKPIWDDELVTRLNAFH